LNQSATTRYCIYETSAKGGKNEKENRYLGDIAKHELSEL
jgi:hypothetical protein